MAVNALNEGNLRVTDGSPSSTGGVVNYNNMTAKLNTANAVIVPLNASGQLLVTPNCGPDCAADTTEVRGVVLGYFTTALAQRVTALETLLDGVTRTTHNGYDTLRLNHRNPWLTNGAANTYTNNGHGNLIVGCDLNPQGFTRTGSHNIVVGNDHGWTNSAGVVFGQKNQINASAATVTGGSETPSAATPPRSVAAKRTTQPESIRRLPADFGIRPPPIGHRRLRQYGERPGGDRQRR